VHRNWSGSGRFNYSGFSTARRATNVLTQLFGHADKAVSKHPIAVGDLESKRSRRVHAAQKILVVVEAGIGHARSQWKQLCQLRVKRAKPVANYG
jgi:hypothetical protein